MEASNVFLLAAFLLISCNQTSTLPNRMINSEDTFSVTLEFAGEVPRIDDFRIMQGGCVTEDYAYFAMIGAENADAYILSECYIIKYDRSTMKEIARSEVLKLGHANDITYVPEANELYVIHVVNRKVSILDADTLTVKDTKRLQLLDSYAIEYNETRDCFVTGIATAGMGFFTRDLKVTGSAEEIDSTLITQGICADDT